MWCLIRDLRPLLILGFTWQIPLENQLEFVIVIQGLLVSQRFILHALAAVHPLTKTMAPFLKEAECWQHCYLQESCRQVCWKQVISSLLTELFLVGYWHFVPERTRAIKMLIERRNILFF